MDYNILCLKSFLVLILSLIGVLLLRKRDMILSSIDKESRNEVKILKRNNETLKNLKFNIIERFFSAAASNYIKYSFSSFIFFLSCCLIIWIMAYFHNIFHPHFIQEVKFLVNENSDNNKVDVIFGAQATIIGLVYPIAIAFVSLQLQSEKFFIGLKAYLDYSGFLFIVLNSLFLLIFIVLQYIVNLLKLPKEIFFSCALVDYMWFGFNILSTMYFLIKTIQFIKPEQQYEVLKKYIANMVWTQYLEKKLKYIRYSNVSNQDNKSSLKLKNNLKNIEESILETVLGVLKKPSLNIEQQSLSEFVFSLEKSIEFHIMMIKIGFFVNNNNNHDNYLLLQYRYFNNIYLLILETYRDIIIQSSMNCIDKSRDYIKKFVMVPYKFFSSTKYQKIFQISALQFDLAKNVIYQLQCWWIIEIQKQGIYNNNVRHPQKLNSPYLKYQQDILRSFVSAWEMLAREINSRRIIHKWEDYEFFYDLSVAYFIKTVEMTLSCLFVGDEEGSILFMDVFQKLFGTIAFKYKGDISYYIKNDVLINGGVFKYKVQSPGTNISENWNEINKKYFLSMGNKIKDTNQEMEEIYNKIIENYSKDCSIVLCYVLMRESKGFEEFEKSLLYDCLKSLLKAIPLKGGNDSIKLCIPFENYDDAIYSFLRQEISSPYRARIDALIQSAYEAFNNLNNEMIAGRIYMTSLDTLYGFSEEKFIILCGLFTLRGNQEFNGSILYDLDSEELKNIKDQLTSFIGNFDFIKYEKWKFFFNCFYSKLTHENFNYYKENVKKYLTSIVNKIKEILDEEIRNATIENDRLMKIANDISSIIDQDYLQKSYAPLAFFKLNQNPLDSKMVVEKFTIQNFSKDKLTNLYHLTSFNNTEIIKADTLCLSLSGFLINQIIPQLEISELIADDPKLYWDAFQRSCHLIKESGNTPTLFVGSAVHPIWIHNWIWQTENSDTPFNLKITKDNKQKNISYLVNFNDIEIYEIFGLSNASFVLPKEIFDKLFFHIFANGLPVRVTWNPNKQGKDIFGDLIIEFNINFSIKSQQIFKLNH